MSYFTEHFWGEKNHGFDVLYHNMKHGQISTKELADFVRERAAIEENYAKAMVKLSKMATNGTQLGTFAPLWEVFRISSDKLALCHLELMKKLHDLIKEISRYGEEQGRVHKKSKEEVAGTLEAVQLLHGVAQLLPKSKESYHSKCQEYERLRKEGTSQKEIDKAELKSRKAGEALRRAVDKYNAARADFEQRMLDSAMRFQEVEEAHLRHMKGLIGSYSHSVEDTHVQIGQVHEEFKQNVENIGTEMLLRRFAESKGTGRERPGALDFDEYRLAPAQEGPKRSRSKAFRIPGLSRKERERDAVESPDNDLGCPEVDEDGFTVRPDTARSEVENAGSSSSDSDYEEAEPRRFLVHIKPREAPGSAQASAEQLRATVGNLILAPGLAGTVRRQASRHVAPLTPAPGDTDPEGTLGAGDSTGRGLPAAQLNSGPGKPPQDSAALFGPPLESAFEAEEFPAPRSYVLTSSSSPFSSSSPENVEDSGLDSPSHPRPDPCPDSRPWTPQPGTPDPKADPNPSSSAPRPPEPPNFAVFSAGGTEGLWGVAARGSSGAAPREAPSPDPFGDPPVWGRPRSPGGEQPPPTRPSSNSASSSSSSPAPPSGGESCSPSPWGCPGGGGHGAGRGGHGGDPPTAAGAGDPSQSDPSTKDFWLNMAALTGHLQKQAEQSPAASYYNVALLKYQFSRLGAGSAPLRLCVRWDCSPGATRVSVEYGYNGAALAPPVPLANVHVLLPVEEPLTNLRLQPAGSWNLEEKRLLWKLLDVPGAPGQAGCGRLSASWEPLGGRKPSPVAALSSEGSTLSGVEVELAGAGYRMSLVKKRFATGIYLAGS
ncbi:LOW QUALITY PROTEIN: F-BAR domain only protein 1 [Acridotheres tristis]